MYRHKPLAATLLIDLHTRGAEGEGDATKSVVAHIVYQTDTE